MLDTATRAAVLGLLALKPFRSYELVKEMGRNLRFFWPRAESRIYAELKRLEEEGLVRSSTSFQGLRSRSTFRATPHGLRALAAWKATEPGGTTLQSDDLLRVFLAAPDDTATVAKAVASVRAEAEELLAVAETIAAEYSAGEAPFQDRVRMRALVFDFLASWAAMRLQWAERADAYLKAVEQLDDAKADRKALAHIRARHAAIFARTRQP
jgi:PadR family transcriptional regulator, regulatory protein AphA